MVEAIPTVSKGFQVLGSSATVALKLVAPINKSIFSNSQKEQLERNNKRAREGKHKSFGKTVKMRGDDSRGGHGSRGGGLESPLPKYGDIIKELHKEKKLPAVVFLFSRKGCDEIAQAVAAE